MVLKSHTAVFTRNHPEYLEQAAQIHIARPGKLIAFRSNVRWATAREVADAQEDTSIYFASIGQGSAIRYVAQLVDVHLVSGGNSTETEALLKRCLGDVSAEDPFSFGGKQLQTLYLVRACRRLSVPFEMTDLVKLSDGEHIQENYGYSYSLVRHHGSIVSDSITWPLPDETVSAGSYTEGTRKPVYVNRYERNAGARDACIKAHGFACQVCEFDFAREYGSHGKGFIHVHHTVPLSAIGEEYEVDPVEDLVPVCPNCHAMIHQQQGTPLTVEELRAVLEENR